MSFEILHSWESNGKSYRLVFDTVFEYSGQRGFDEYLLCKLEVEKRFLGIRYWSLLKTEKVHEDVGYKFGNYYLYPNEIGFDLIKESKENFGLRIN